MSTHAPESCVICLDKFVDEFPVVTHCRHTFGNTCLERWFLQSDSCPLCRTKLPNIAPAASHAVQGQTRAQAPVLPSQEPWTSPSIWERIMRRPRPVFQRQIWDVRMGGLGFANPHFDGARNAPRASSDTGPGTLRVPSSTTTTHGHPPVPTTTMFTAAYVRRTYANANMTSYTLRNPGTHAPQRSHPTRQPAGPPTGEGWRNWDYISGSRRRSWREREGERGSWRRLPSSDSGGTSINRETTLVRARCRSEMNRRRETSSVEEDLAQLPRLMSSMWAPSSS
ncbi:hypothetical protein NHQ30_003422 [Ciborinia camelliae]|nr:hypothetical protein NHQ30_003422 [Ciborinia camelliae]